MSLTRLFQRPNRVENHNVAIADFIYKPFIHEDSIRLLILRPGVAMMPLRCRLETRRLGDGPSYDALSYVWGPPSPCRKINLDGLDFVIRENLYLALQQIRHSTKSRSLWIDAVCINQHDIPERNHQVQQMKRIYESATVTLIWLGLPQRNATPALRLLQKFESPKFGAPVVEGTDMVTEKLYPKNSSQAMDKAFVSFFSNEWFTRAWIQQEFVVSSNVLFLHGEYLLEPATVDHAIKEIWDLSENHFGLRNVVFQPQSLYLYRDNQIKGSKPSLPTILYETFGELKATDPRDHIFSLLGLAKDGDSSLVVVDYKASVEDVFVEAVSQCLKYHHPENSFLLLSLAGYLPQGQYRKSLPSWVPDFSSQRVFGRSFCNKVVFSASEGSEPGFSIEARLLKVRGKVVDTIGNCLVCPFEWPVSFSPDDSRKWVSGCYAFAKREGTFYEAVKLEDVWWRLLVCDLFWGGNVERFRTAQEFYGEHYLNSEILLQEWITEGHCTVNDADFLDMQKAFNSTRSRISAMLDFCSTGKGMLGWIPRTAKAGDKICIFTGAPAPFIIRDRHDETYELIGDAYIHGIMYGESMEWEGLEWEEIKIT